MDTIKPKVIMLCGMPSSGKSTYAKELSEEENAITLSSDQLRIELYNDVNHQENNGELFVELYRRAKQHLKNGQNVLIDATNTSRKRRIHFINEFKSYYKELHYIGREYEECVWRDKHRERTVGKHIIKRMFNQLEVPLVEEGWDNIEYILESNEKVPNKSNFEAIITQPQSHDELFYILMMLKCFGHIYNMPQDSKYHSLSVSRHTYYVWEYVLNNYHEEDKLIMLWTALLHDTGKFYAKNFKEGSRYANYIGHEHSSSQIAMLTLNNIGYDLDFTLKVVKLVELHMRLLNGGENAERKVLNMYGEDILDKLKFFREADTQAK